MFIAPNVGKQCTNVLCQTRSQSFDIHEYLKISFCIVDHSAMSAQKESILIILISAYCVSVFRNERVHPVRYWLLPEVNSKVFLFPRDKLNSFFQLLAVILSKTMKINHQRMMSRIARLG